MQRRPRADAKKVAVAGEGVVVPKVEGEPRAAHGPDAGAKTVDRIGVAPDVGVVVGDKATGAIVLLCHFDAGAAGGVAEHVYEVKERRSEVAESGDFSRPVVHFCIDVDGVLATPGVDDAAGPEALEIGGQAAGAA